MDLKKLVTMFSFVVVCDSIRQQEKQVVNEVNFEFQLLIVLFMR